MIDPDELRQHVIRPTLDYLGMGGESAESLMLATALCESGLSNLVQKGGGPARGLWQVEPATHDDVWWTFLAFKPPLEVKMERMLNSWQTRHDQLTTDPCYCCAIARLKYWRDPEPLPDDAEGGCLYHKRVFNSVDGKADPEKTMWAFTAVY